MPKSRGAALPRKRANCTTIGSLSPSSWRSLRALLERRVLSHHLVDGIADEAEQRNAISATVTMTKTACEQPADGECEHIVCR